MEHFFHTVRITNFKSLKNVTLSDCKRINVLIGKPNVGKSNILEAIGLFGIGYSHLTKNKSLSQFIRATNFRELFFDGNTKEQITVSIDYDSSNYSFCRVNVHEVIDDDWNAEEVIEILYSIEGTKSKFTLDKAFNIKLIENGTFFRVKQYKFLHGLALENIWFPYLMPPFGVNLLYVIQEHKQLKKELASFFSDYGLKLVFDTANHKLQIMKELKDDEVFLLPYDSIADTLQRIIFYKAAIASNQDSILLFEEPEAHCFPPYIAHFTQEVINSETNQFFIATHSPYVLNDFLEYERNDVAIFIANFKNGETVIRRLTDDEVNDVYQYGIDLFFNHELFTDDQEH
nr:AAA family ATPase [Crenothrix polyspora]